MQAMRTSATLNPTRCGRAAHTKAAEAIGRSPTDVVTRGHPLHYRSSRLSTRDLQTHRTRVQASIFLPETEEQQEEVMVGQVNASTMGKPGTPSGPVNVAQQQRLARKAARAREQTTYKVAAIAATLGVTALAAAAVHYRFTWHLRAGGQFPYAEAIATMLLTLGGVVGMELWAQWAHKALWHDFQPGWALHKSHHEPRVGPFEANDVFAIVNAIPAMGLCLFGFLTPSLLGGICFGAGLGITLFGIMYMFIHDGLVHRRFPVGPIANVPYLRRVAMAHKLHHAEKYNGVPWGMFLGPMELEAVGAKEVLDRMCEGELHETK